MVSNNKPDLHVRFVLLQLEIVTNFSHTFVSSENINEDKVYKYANTIIS